MRYDLLMRDMQAKRLFQFRLSRDSLDGTICLRNFNQIWDSFKARAWFKVMLGELDVIGMSSHAFSARGLNNFGCVDFSKE